ncbi:MAG: pteridine reductase [Thermoanaerobaculum sp.]|nr:MAG: pteridine reductase [Thermoanaerobaculum sp.]
MPEPLTALVTGGARRVGKAIVQELIAHGATVAFTYWHSGAEARALEAAYSGQAIALRCPLEEPEARAQLVARVQELFPHLSALVHNAAVFPRTPLAELTVESFRQTLAVNLEAPLFLSRDLADALRRGQGAIVNVADVYAFLPLKNFTAYVVSKAALAATTRQLAVELAPDVRVNAVAPGIAAFPESYDQETRERLIARTLLKKAGSPEEIARAVRFLLFEASTVTGEVLTVDAGRRLFAG